MQAQIMNRQESFPPLTRSPEEIDEMWANLYDDQPKSPPMKTLENEISYEYVPISPTSFVDDDMEAIFEEVMSMDSNPSSPQSPFSDSQSNFVPDIDPTLMIKQNDFQEPKTDVEIESQPPKEVEVRTIMTDNGELLNVVILPQSQIPTNFEIGPVVLSPRPKDDEYVMKSSPAPSAGPLTPPPSVPSVSEGSPMDVNQERIVRKRSQNKESSKKYRQKIKNKNQALYDAVDALIKKKRDLDVELASTKAVNKFLEDSIKQKFGIF